MTWTETKVGDSKLVLHCGGRNVTWDELKAIPTPKHTETHYPISHTAFVEAVMDGLSYHGMRSTGEAYAVAGDQGQRFFGVIGLENRDENMQWVLGIQGSHDKSSTRRGILGSRVFVCDNMGFSGSAVFEFSRKHTLNIFRDLPRIVSNKLASLPRAMSNVDSEIKLMQSVRIDSMLRGADNGVYFNDAIVRLYRSGAITATQIPHVIKEFNRHGIPGGHEGPHDESMALPTPWKLLNCVTEINRVNSVEDTPRRTQVADRVCYQVALEAYNRGAIAGGVA